MPPRSHSLIRRLPFAGLAALATLSSDSSAASLPLSFHLSTSPSAVALQFDVGFSVSGVSVGTPVLLGASPHQIDSELQADGKTRFVIYSSTNTAIAPTGAVEVTLNLDDSTLQDGIMSVSGVIASSSSGTSVNASPGVKPLAFNVSPPSLTKALIGSNVPVGVEIVDLDGSITSVLFRLNGSPIGSATNRPFTTTATSLTPGNFNFTAFAQDNAGNSLVSPPVTLQFIDPAALSTYSAFQAAWLDGTGTFTADPFNTGIPNGLAWALGMNPGNPDRSRLPTHFIEENEGEKFLVYRARVLAGGVVPQILSSTTMASNDWPAVPAGQITETLEAGGWKLIEARLPITEPVPRRFVQLAVEEP
jgi:hypothetical protein